MNIKLLIFGAMAALAITSSTAANADIPSYGDIVYAQTNHQVILPSDAWKGQTALFNSVSGFGSLVNAAPDLSGGVFGYNNGTKVSGSFLGATASYFPGDLLQANGTTVLAAKPVAGATFATTTPGTVKFDVTNPDPTFKNGKGQTVHAGAYTYYTTPSSNADLGNHYKTYDVISGGGAYAHNVFFGLEDQSFKGASDRDFNDYVFTANFQPVPEPAFYQLGALLLAGGLMLIRSRRRQTAKDA